MQPGDFIELRPDDNGRDVHGHVIREDGTVSPYSSLVATTYGTAAIRRKTANRIVLGPRLIEAIREVLEAHAADVYFDPNPSRGGETERVARCLQANETARNLLNLWEKGITA